MSRRFTARNTMFSFSKNESGNEVCSEEELTDPNGRFNTIPSGPPTEESDIKTLNALRLALKILWKYEGKPIYEAMKSIRIKMNTIM